jgi:hypothetical protein
MWASEMMEKFCFIIYVAYQKQWQNTKEMKITVFWYVTYKMVHIGSYTVTILWSVVDHILVCAVAILPFVWSAVFCLIGHLSYWVHEMKSQGSSVDNFGKKYLLHLHAKRCRQHVPIKRWYRTDYKTHFKRR